MRKLMVVAVVLLACLMMAASIRAKVHYSNVVKAQKPVL